ncbi:hypothetical protein E2320_011984 [Naja naja]|nr:hypothetical protein E2320_011984 [Naja naja]
MNHSSGLRLEFLSCKTAANIYQDIFPVLLP